MFLSRSNGAVERFKSISEKVTCGDFNLAGIKSIKERSAIAEFDADLSQKLSRRTI